MCDFFANITLSVAIFFSGYIKLNDIDLQASLVKSIRKQDMGQIRYLLQYGTDVNFTFDEHLETPLHLSIYFLYLYNDRMHMNKEIVKLLIEYGANVNAKNLTGMTPLHILCSTHSNDTIIVAKLLIDNGADINTQEYVYRFTPLHLAAKAGNKKLINFLLDSGADKDIEANYSKKAEDMTNNQEIIELINNYVYN